ncbi:MAG: efflux RND transporter periplasmic adaptor subunit [Pseudomonadota bacterium]
MKRVWSILGDIFWLAVAVAIVAGGVLGFQYLGANRTVVEPEPFERSITLVDGAVPERFTEAVPVRGEGFVTAMRELAVAAETSGRIVEMHPAIDTRGKVAAGEVLVRLDDRAARASLAQTEANIASTQARLDLNQTQVTRAESLRRRGVIPQEQLDQLLATQTELTATLNSLRAARDSAEIALDRLTVRAPFDGAVLRKHAELGAVVSPGQAIADIFTDDALEVTVPIRQADAALIEGLFDGARVPAQVQAKFGGQDYVWQGEVRRVENTLDTTTRTLNVTVALLDRDAGRRTSGTALPSGAPPALLNAFANVTIDGARFDGLYAIPSTSLRSDGDVWLAQDGTLSVLPAEVVHVDGEQTFVRLPNLPGEALLITSALETPVPGMDVQVVGQEDTRTAALSEE